MESEPWWQGFFDEDYLNIWSPLHSAEQNEAEAKTLVELLELEQGDSLLDAPCGYGRMSFPLQALGLRVVGVDFSVKLLSEAQATATKNNSDTVFMQGDLRDEDIVHRAMSHLPHGSKGFDAAANLFSSIGYGSEEDDKAQLQTIYAALRPGGRFFIDTMHRDAIVYRIALGQKPGFRGLNGLVVKESNSFDPIAGRIESKWAWNSPTQSGSKSSSMRLYSTTELIAIVKSIGFTDIQCFSGISHTPLQEAEMGSRLGIFCRRP